MTSREQHGLVISGGLTRSLFAHTPSLHRKLGPVKGTTLSATRRVVGALHIGKAVQLYADLRDCRVIWICVPDAELNGVVRELAEHTTLRRAMIVLCDTRLDSSDAEELLHHGARVATLMSADDSPNAAILIEGHADTVRMVRGMLPKSRAVIQVLAGAKANYLEAVRLLTDAWLPCLKLGVGHFITAGLKRNDAQSLAESLVARSLRGRVAKSRAVQLGGRVAKSRAVQHG